MAASDHLNRAQFPITHEVTGWGAARTNAYGSQQPGWQSGTLHARGPAGESLGHLDYSTIGHLGDRTDVGVADLKVPKQHQRKGVASALMDHLYHEARTLRSITGIRLTRDLPGCGNTWARDLTSGSRRPATRTRRWDRVRRRHAVA